MTNRMVCAFPAWVRTVELRVEGVRQQLPEKAFAIVLQGAAEHPKLYHSDVLGGSFAYLGGEECAEGVAVLTLELAPGAVALDVRIEPWAENRTVVLADYFDALVVCGVGTGGPKELRSKLEYRLSTA